MSGVPYFVGSNAVTSGGGGVLFLNPSADVASGDLLYVGVLMNTATTVTVTDSQNQAYNLIGSDVVNTTTQLYIFSPGSSVFLNHLTENIMVNYASNSSVEGAIAVADNGVNAIDKVVLAHGTSTAPSVASGALSQQSENCIAFIVDTNAGGVPSWNATFSGNVLQNVTAGATTRLSAAYATVNSVASVTAAATITSANWAIGIITDATFSPVTTTLLSDGLRGEPYSQTLESTGGVGSYTYALTAGSFPAGVTMTAGVISGTPTAIGTFPVTIQVTDSHGVQNITSQVITIADSSPSPAPSPVMANNILTIADSTFESGSPTWASEVNASAPATTFLTALTGNQCLVWNSLADGLTQIATGFYTVKPNKPYTLSGYVWPTGNLGNDCFIGVEWYTSGNVLIRTDLGDDLSSSPVMWQGVNLTAFSPANAAKAKVIAQVAASNKGDRNHLDMVSFVQSDVQILIDFVNPPFGASSAAGNDFFDVSPWVRLDLGIDISRGRSDAVSEISAGSAFWQMQNDSGMFTRYNANSPIVVMGGAVRLQERAQINICDEKGVWHTRFDGAVASIDYAFENSGAICLATYHAADMLAELNRQNPLTNWTREQALLDGPAFHWALDDAPNASSAASICVESSGNNGPPMRVTSTDDTKVATAAFQDSTSGVEVLADAVIAGQPDGSAFWNVGSTQPTTNLRGLVSGGVGPFSTPQPSVRFTPVLVAQSAQNTFVGNKGMQLSAVLPSPGANVIASGGTTAVSAISSGQDFSLECWFVMDTAISSANALNYGPYTILSLGSTRTSVHTMVAGIFLNSGGTKPKVGVKTYSQPPAFFGRNFTAGSPSIVSSVTQDIGLETTAVPHHMVITVQGDSAAPLLSLYIDGLLVGSFTLPASQAYDTITVGGAFGGSGCFSGNISLVSIYPYLLSVSQLQLHTQLGQYGMWESLTDDCIAQLAKYATIPPFWNNITGQHAGLSLTEYLDITGSNAYTAMTAYEQAERGLLYVDASGQLNFHTRDWRMGYGGPDLELPQDTFTADMGLGVVDQFQINQAQVTTSTLQSGASAVNAESQDEYGTYVGTDQNLPLITWSRAYSKHGLPAFSFWPEPNLVDYVAWDANSKADPWLLPSQVTIDMKTLAPASGLGISDFYAVDIDNVVAPSSTDALPDFFPNQNFSTEWFIEGVTEHKDQNSHTIQFFTSPAEPQRAWQPGDPTYGALGSTTRLGISAADTNAPPADGKSVSHDGGPPYWVSGFSTGALNKNGSFESASSANFSEDYEEGTGGVTITALNSNFQSVSGPPAGGTFQFDGTHIGHGTLAAKIATGVTAGSVFGHFHMDGSTSTSQWWRGEYYFTANPAAQLNLLTVKDQSGNTLMVLHLSTGGVLAADGNAVTGVGSIPNTIPLNSAFRIEVELVSDPTDGEIHLYRYNSVNGLTPTDCIHITGINTGGGVPYDWQCGGFTNSLSNVTAFWTDAQAVSDSFPLGPPASEVLPWTAINNSKISASTLWSSGGNQALLIAGDGVTASGGAESEIITTIVPGLSYTLSADLYSPAGWATGATIEIQWLDASAVQISTSLVTTPLLKAVKASAQVTDFAPPGATQARLFAQWSGTPASTVQLLVDDIFLVQNVVAGATLNNPSANGHGFLGANDLRTMTDSLTKLLEPPLTVVGAAGGSQQAITSGSLGQPQLFWDFMFADTTGALGLIPGWPNWYVCLLPGFYEIDAHAIFERSSTLGGKAYQGWIVVATDAATGILNGSLTPVVNLAYNEPVGEIIRRNANNVTNIVCSPTQRVYLGLGDMVTLAAEQDSGGTVNTGNVLGGSQMSVRFVGYARKDDRYNINSTISSGGAVTVPVVPSPNQISYSNTHTYSYYGNSAGGGRKNTDGVCYQNYASGFFATTGSQKSQIAFDYAKIKSDLTGKTIDSVTLSCKNDHTWYGSGGKLQVGVVFDTLGSSKWNPTTTANSLGDLQEQHFDEGKPLTFTLNNSIINYFINGDGNGHFAKGLRTGGSNGSLAYYGYWHGGPAQWTMTVKFH